MKSLLWGTAAVAVVLVVVLSGLGVLVSVAPSGPAAPRVDFSAPVSGPLKDQVVAAASAAAEKAHLSPTETQSAIAKVSAESPNQLLSQAGFSPTTISAFDSCGPLPGSCASNLGAGLGGCAIGAGLGAIGGGPVGAGVGCVVGAAAALLIFQFGLGQANDQSNLAQYIQWAQANMASAGNDWNLTTASYENLISALNFSELAFQRMADSAALLQLNNSSFNIAQDQAQSGISAQFGTILESYATQMLQPIALLNEWAFAQLAPSSTFGTDSPVFPYGGSQPSNGEYDAATYGGVSMGSAAGTWNTTFWIPPGTTKIWSLEAACTSLAVHPVLGTGWTQVPGIAGLPNSASGTIPCGYSYVFSQGYYQVSSSVATTAVFVPGGAGFATSTTSDISGWSPASTNSPVGFFDAQSGPAGIQMAGVGSTYPSASFGQSTFLVTWNTNPLSNPVAANIGLWLGSLAFQAATNGEVYWSFLRSIGYTSVSQIPPDCIVPAPYQILPSDLNLSSLSVSQLQALYLAWLQGLGTFYNTSLNAASFCGTQSGHKFNLNNTIWGNLFINATGYVYLNNGTAPISPNGKLLATETYGNRSTWALAKVQLLLMPTLASVSIPVGTNWAVPANDPVQIYAIQPGLMLRLTGNGSSTGLGASLVPFATSPGDSLYLTSCTVGGVAQANCTVTVQTIITTTGNLTCLGSGSSSPASCQPQNTGGTFGGFPNPFSWLSNLLSGLFGGGPLGALLGGIVSALLILAVIGILAYVVIVEVGGWGSRKRGGGGGGGGTTVITSGGR